MGTSPIQAAMERLTKALDDIGVPFAIVGAMAVNTYGHAGCPRPSPGGRSALIWNAPYTPELNLIERYWGHLKSTSLNNYYFETVEQLEDAIRAAVTRLNRRGQARMSTAIAVLRSCAAAA